MTGSKHTNQKWENEDGFIFYRGEDPKDLDPNWWSFKVSNDNGKSTPDEIESLTLFLLNAPEISAERDRYLAMLEKSCSAIDSFGFRSDEYGGDADLVECIKKPGEERDRLRDDNLDLFEALRVFVEMDEDEYVEAEEVFLKYASARETTK